MERSVLKELGLDDEVIGKVMAEHGKSINDLKGQLTAETAKVESLEKQVVEHKSNLEEIKKSGANAEELKATIEKMEADNKAKEEEAVASLQKTKLDYEIDLALVKSGAKNAKAAKALLDTEKIKLGEKGVEGLEEAITAIKADNDYLFNEGDPAPIPKAVAGGNKQGGAPTGKTWRDSIKDNYDKIKN